MDWATLPCLPMTLPLSSGETSRRSRVLAPSSSSSSITRTSSGFEAMDLAMYSTRSFNVSSLRTYEAACCAAWVFIKSRHRFGWLGALADPAVGALAVENHRGRICLGIIVTQLLDECAIARRPGIGDDDAVAGLAFRSNPLKSYFQQILLRFGPR